MLAFIRRTAAGDALVLAFNLGGGTVSWRAPGALAPVGGPVPAPASVDGADVELPAYGALIACPDPDEAPWPS